MIKNGKSNGKNGKAKPIKNGENGRDKGGKFAKGNQAKTGKLGPHKASIDSRVLRLRICDSWDRVNADEKLDELANKDFPTYLKVVASLLPKDVDLTTGRPIVVFSEGQAEYVEDMIEKTDGKLTPEGMMENLSERRRKRIGENGKN